MCIPERMTPKCSPRVLSVNHRFVIMSSKPARDLGVKSDQTQSSKVLQVVSYLLLMFMFIRRVNNFEHRTQRMSALEMKITLKSSFCSNVCIENILYYAHCAMNTHFLILLSVLIRSRC